MGSVAGTLALAVLPGQALAATATEIVITGSRIPQKNLVTTSPVVTIGSADVNTQGITKVEDLTNQLPQVFAGQNASVANGATGAATVDLRALGAQRTLTLIDGRRMPYGSPINSSAPDLNQIPGQLIDRIEVLTGGASAVYGSDALAGVVNFIMKRDFEGLRLDAQYGIYQHNQHDDVDGNLDGVVAIRNISNPSEYRLPERSVADGDSREISIIAGAATADNRGHIEGYFSWRRNDAVLQANRNFSACSIATAGGGNNALGRNGAGQTIAGFPRNTEFKCGGSPTNARGTFAGPTGTFTIDALTGQFVPTDVFVNDASVDAYNFGPLNYYQRPDERYSFGAFGNYDLWSGAEFYADFMFNDYQTNAQIAPSGAFFGNITSVNCGNPFIAATGNPAAVGCTPAAIAANSDVTLYLARRNVEGGGRQDHRNLWSYRTVVGIRGTAWEGWDYDLSLQRSKSVLDQVYKNDMSIERQKKALNVVNTGPDGILGNADDAPICQSVLDGTDPACVPYNIFNLGGVTAAALAYVQIPLVRTASEVQSIVNGSVTGDIGPWGFKSPWADDGVKIALGFEVRRDELHDIADTSFTTGDGAGQGGPRLTAEGATDLWEIFSEVQIPLVQNVWLAKQISIDAGYRYSDYDNPLHTHTYKVGADWAPTDDVRLRASYSRAVRAPNILELFAPSGIGLFNATGGDPCSAAAALLPGLLNTNCLATGANAGGFMGTGALNNPAGQYNGNFGGNLALDPEVGRTLTLGAVFTPTMVPGLVASIDWFNIRVSHAISTVGGVNVLNGCYTSNIAALCNFINRNPGNGRLWGNAAGYVDLLNTNIGYVKTQGVDVNVSYTFDFADMGWANVGSLNASLIGTWVDYYVVDAGVGAPSFDCAGFWGFAGTGPGHEDCTTPTPEWRHRFRLTWDTPWHFDLTGTWRYYAATDRHGASTVSFNGGSPGQFLGASIDAYNYFDFSGNIHLSKSVVARLGVNNAFDLDPPLLGSYQPAGVVNGNTFPQVYDSLGRYIFGGITIDF